MFYIVDVLSTCFMKKTTLLLPFIALLLVSCEVASEETSVPTDTVGAALDTATGITSSDGVSIDYFKNVPSVPLADAQINSMLSSGKWVVVDYQVRNLDYQYLPHATPTSIHDQSLYPLRDFSMIMNADQTMQLKKSQAADCTRRLFQVNRMGKRPILTLLCEETRMEMNFEILGLNEKFLYLKEERGLYPFEVYYVMKKE